MSSSSPLSSSAEKIVECVPNFSEGKRADVIEAIASAIRASDGCTLLDVDPGESTNRTVYTFVGTPFAVVEGALQAARVAHKLIDMTKHHGMAHVEANDYVLRHPFLTPCTPTNHTSTHTYN